MIYILEFTVKCPFIVCTQTAHGPSHVVTNVLRKAVSSGSLESDIGKVWDMSEIATKHKVYCYFNQITLTLEKDSENTCIPSPSYDQSSKVKEVSRF